MDILHLFHILFDFCNNPKKQIGIFSIQVYIENRKYTIDLQNSYNLFNVKYDESKNSNKQKLQISLLNFHNLMSIKQPSIMIRYQHPL